MKQEKEFSSTANQNIDLYNPKVRIIGIPLVSLVLTSINYSLGLYPYQNFLVQWLIAFVYTLVLWEANIKIFIWSRKMFPHFNQTKKRLVLQTLAEVVFINVFLFIADYQILPRLGFYCESYFSSLLQCLIPTVIITLIYESAYFFILWKDHIVKTESLVHENIKSQLDALKSQLDPHFLFNSLNTLAALVGEENVNAQTFLAQLSDVYRYVLVNREKNTVSLQEEIEFLDAYVYLNNIRFRENLRVENRISASSMDKKIAPLSLQLLMENAIKHNAASRENPLVITIRDNEDGYIVVENNKQEKKILEKSLKVGLQNIVNRYKLLTEKNVFIIDESLKFTVKIPFLTGSTID
ncbi:MAG TPA: histidine kinase [Cytophagaceae bacterium]|jgi:uncharacterized membrane protein YczE